MKTSLLTTVLLLVFGSFTLAKSIPHDSLYFGQTPPGNVPKVFAPGIVSLPNRKEAVITFSPDGASVFFYIETYPNPGTPYTMFSTYSNNHWSTPDTIPFSFGRATGEPFFAFNGNRLYMFASNAVNHHGIVDLCYSEKQGNNWSSPVSLGNPPNSEAYQYHPCIVGDSSIYFSSEIGYICRSQYSNGAYQSRVILPNPINHVGTQTWGDPYVSPAETYMIFKSIREGGYGQHDLYISYRKTDGSWTNPKNLGNVINTPNDETAGDITPDGLYMTYGSNSDMYWVSSGFIDSLRYTNFIPYVKNPIPSQTAVLNQWFVYTIPDTTFIDDDGNNTLTYSAKLLNGNPLPSWLAFDTLTATFSGMPPSLGNLYINVTATDTAGASVLTTMVILVKETIGIYQAGSEEKTLRIFPNPTHGMVTVSLEKSKDGPAVLDVYTIEGENIQTNTFKRSINLDLTTRPRGMYFVKVVVDNEILVSKINLD